MADEIRQAERARRAAMAHAEYGELEQAFEAERSNYLNLLVKTGPKEADLRERYYLAIRVLDAVKKNLLAVAADGRLVEHERAYGERQKKTIRRA